MGVIEELLDAQILTVGDVPGILTGLVKENWDEDHPGMVKVEYFLGEKGKNLTGWVPVAVPYAGKEYGYYALPEVGTEVVLAFQMGNRNSPIVLGCIWSQQNSLPGETANENNSVKKLMTKGGCEIRMAEEDGKEQILVQTPKGLNLLLEDENETISLSSQDGSSGVKVDAKNGAVTVLADKKLELQVGGNVMLSLDGSSNAVEIKGGKLTLNADQSLELKGQTLKLEGTSTEIKGSGTLKLEAGGTAQLKGAMVQLN